MNGGDTDTGGAKVNPNNTPSLTPQPDTSTTSDAEAESILTISHDDHPTSVGSQPLSQPATIESTASPTPPVQSVPSTTASTPTAQPASSTMPVPPITDFPQSAPQTPQPVGRPVAPVVTPANQFASSTATALPPRPLTPSQFPPQQPVQFPAQPIPASSGDVVLDSSAPKKSRKGLIIVLILLAVLAIGAIVALVVFQSSRNGNSDDQSSQNNTEQFSTKEEVYSALYDFNYQYYSSLIKYYSDSIGLIPNLKMSEYDIMIPLENTIAYMVKNTDEATDYYNSIYYKIPDQLYEKDNMIEIQPAKEEITTSLQNMQKNISLINDFHDAYILPLSKDPRPSTCAKTPEMEALEQGQTAETAAKYFSLYCQAVDFLNKSNDYTTLQQSIATQAADAANSLNQLLIEVPSAEDKINRLFEEFTK